MSNSEENNTNETAYNKIQKLNRFKRTLLYVLTAVQFYLCIVNVILDSNKEYSNISSSVIFNRLLFGFIIVTIINGFFGWSIGYSFFVDKEDKKTYFYDERDRNFGRIISIISFILFLTVILSFTASFFDVLK